MAVDARGNVVAADEAGSRETRWDFTVAKWDPTGQRLWTQTLNGTARDSEDRATSVLVDSRGNVIAGGRLQDLHPQWHYNVDEFVIGKWDPDGSLLWTRHMKKTGLPLDLAVDRADRVIAAGWLADRSGFLVAKFDAAGTSLWARTLWEPPEDPRRR